MGRTDTRLIGAGAGLLLGGMVFIRVQMERWPGSLNLALASAMVVIAPVLGWLFAPEAAGPRAANGLRATLWVSLIGVVVGAFLTAGIASLGVTENFGDQFRDTVAVGLIGLILFGLPAMLPAILVTLVWVGMVRVGVRVLR